MHQFILKFAFINRSLYKGQLIIKMYNGVGKKWPDGSKYEGTKRL
jgi:hypothetical protein